MTARGGQPSSVTIVAHDVGGIGGMERQLEQLVIGLARMGREVLVVARGCALGAEPNVRVLRVPGPARPFVIAYPWFFLMGSLAVLLKRRGLVHATGAIVANPADVITAHFCHSAFDEGGGVVRRSRASPAHRLNAWAAARLSRAAERWCYRPSRARRLVGVSRGVSRELERHFPELSGRVQTIPNGLDTATFRPPSEGERGRARDELWLPRERLVALFVASEWEGKGLALALEALAQASDWSLVVLGRGDLGAYRSLARSLRVLDRVAFLEPRRDVVPVFHAADTFLLPTVYESFSLVSHEAAACGLPLLVTRVSGVDELLEDGVNGWFIEREASDIARRLRQLGHDAAARRLLGAAAREASLRFSWEAMVRGYGRVYDELAPGT